MPGGLQRFYGAGYSHFITTSCYQRRTLLGNAQRRDWFVEILEQTRRAYEFVVIGYVIMPEHVHLLIGEPEKADPSVVMQVVKQRFAQRVIESWQYDHAGAEWPWKDARGAFHVWQPRFYDFVVWSTAKRVEKLDYMHENPMKRGLVREPGAWPWSSFRRYAYDEPGLVLVNEKQHAKMRTTNPQTWSGSRNRAKAG